MKATNTRYHKYRIPGDANSLIKNHVTGLYELTERGIKYCMSFETLADLRTSEKYKTIKSWYKALDAETKKDIGISMTAFVPKKGNDKRREYFKMKYRKWTRRPINV